MHAYLLYRLFRNGRHCDFIIQCGEQQFDVHKAILYGRCGWFKETIEDTGEVRFARLWLRRPYSHVNSPRSTDTTPLSQANWPSLR